MRRRVGLLARRRRVPDGRLSCGFSTSRFRKPSANAAKTCGGRTRRLRRNSWSSREAQSSRSRRVWSQKSERIQAKKADGEQMAELLEEGKEEVAERLFYTGAVSKRCFPRS